MNQSIIMNSLKRIYEFAKEIHPTNSMKFLDLYKFLYGNSDSISFSNSVFIVRLLNYTKVTQYLSSLVK